jgi:EF hand
LKQQTLIAVGIAALLPLAAMAAEGYGKSGNSAKAQFDTLDANRDGRLSQTEAAIDSKIVFSTADANGDGYLDKTEWRESLQRSAHPAPQSDPGSPRQ